MRVFHKTQVRFLNTDHYFSGKQVKKHPNNKTEYLIKDPFVKKLLNNEHEDYRIAISNLGADFGRGDHSIPDIRVSSFR